jgi:hypothetical protein
MGEQQRVPDLEGMDERAAHEFLTELYSLLSAEAEDRIRHDEYTMEWPQSGERLRGRQKMKAFVESNAGLRPPRWPRRVLVREELWVVEGSVDYLWRARLGLRVHPGAARGEGLQRDPLLRRTVRGVGGAGGVVRADGALGKARELLRTPCPRSWQNNPSTHSGE